MDSLGRRGEVWLAEFLEKAGWTIRARNWRRPGLELDLVVYRRDTLAFIEVKTRRRGSLDPLELMPYRKARTFMRGVARYLDSESTDVGTIRLLLAALTPRPDGFVVHWWPLDVGESEMIMASEKTKRPRPGRDLPFASE